MSPVLAVVGAAGNCATLSGIAPMEAPQIIEVAIPDGVGEGEEFLVEFDGTQFNIAVPEGCGPGMLIQVEVPAVEPVEEPAAEPPPAEPEAAAPKTAGSSSRTVDQAADRTARLAISDSSNANSSSYASGQSGTRAASSSSAGGVAAPGVTGIRGAACGVRGAGCGMRGARGVRAGCA